MKYFLTPIFTLFTVFVLISCGKDGQPEPVGGDLPTNYIIISDGAFSPKQDTAVNGTSFTFINRSGSVKGIYSLDSMVINKQGIADNSSYFFKKDTVGTIIYRMAGKPSVTGSITITP
ncbi:MAG: hypothetical protein ACKVOM_13935 [Ferruginibacter sp.]